MSEQKETEINISKEEWDKIFKNTMGFVCLNILAEISKIAFKQTEHEVKE